MIGLRAALPSPANHRSNHEERQSNMPPMISATPLHAPPQATRVGVVGEFSSGKSTLINTWLASRLLKTSCLPSTARPTWIRAGSELTVATSVSGIRRTVATEREHFDLCCQVRWVRRDVARDTSLQGLIDIITADPIVSASVGRIDITTPAFPFGTCAVLIDTPGIGAGAAYARDHAQLTETVIGEALDCAIVAIPSASPMTRTLIEFLNTTLQRLLDNCVFVLTGMDRHDESTRTDIRRYVEGMLVRDCGLARPMLFEAGLGSQGGEGAGVAAGYWRGQADALRSLLREWIAEQEPASPQEPYQLHVRQTERTLTT